ncbi:MAG: 4Fe-4S binding protein, partial [Desulfocapsaceae bacterium]|nr:4Fe-4S binding protein [Desulfocapsaceae bacterium]
MADDPAILLQSGFNSLGGIHHTMLSPALQVNGDLGSLNDEQLLKFAEAERIRKNQVSFSSYTIEADNRLCVISNDSQSLNRFLDTYGGVFDIVPLLVNASHPDFSEVTDFSVSFTDSTCRLKYSTRSPVDPDKCTYCGLCGRSCPESCISEALFFDFSTCSFCRDCEKICPTGAIDIDAVEQNELEISALLALGDTPVEGIDGYRNFYRESTLDRYLATLFPSRIDEVITCNHAICQFSSRTESGCDKCIQACAFDALRGEEKIIIDPLTCTECGSCVSICPTGAMQYQRFDDTAFFEFFRTFSLEQTSIVVIGAEKELHSFWWNFRGGELDTGTHVFFEYPQLNA